MPFFKPLEWHYSLKHLMLICKEVKMKGKEIHTSEIYTTFYFFLLLI